jgi:hypothetical protein
MASSTPSEKLIVERREKEKERCVDNYIVRGIWEQ